MTQERLALLMRYCCVSEGDDLERRVLEQAYEAAVSYMTEAGITAPQEGSSRLAPYDQCVNYLTLDFYDRRVTSITGTIVADNPGFRRLINQLKLTDPSMRF